MMGLHESQSLSLSSVTVANSLSLSLLCVRENLPLSLFGYRGLQYFWQETELLCGASCSVTSYFLNSNSMTNKIIVTY